jgi:hypothetical protein
MDSSVVLKAIAVQFSLLDRACRAAHSVDIGFSKYCYSPGAPSTEMPRSLTDDSVLVLPSSEYWRNSVWRRAINPTAGIVVHDEYRTDPAYVLSGFRKNVNGAFSFATPADILNF